MKTLTKRQMQLREKAIADGAVMMKEIHGRPGFDESQVEWHKEYDASVALCAARKRAGLSQEAVARRMEVPRSNVSRIEAGLNITFATFTKYLRACGFDFTINIRPSASSVPSLQMSYA